MKISEVAKLTGVTVRTLHYYDEIGLLKSSEVSWPLITSSFSCTIFSDMVYRLLSEWCVVTSFYQSSANRVSFYPISNLRNLFYLIRFLQKSRKNLQQAKACWR